jgi:toxin ParE1/3/4
MKVFWTQLAIGDLDSAYEYISDENPAAAVGLIERIKKSVAMLPRHPQLGRLGRVEGTRELVVSGTPFVIPYRAKRGRIEVLAVMHAARRWPDVL